MLQIGTPILKMVTNSEGIAMADTRFKVIYDDCYLNDYPTASCEIPERVSAIVSTLKGHYTLISPRPASEAEILGVHTRAILKEVQRDAGTWESAAMAAGGALLAAEMAMNAHPTFAAVRPPGHHASPASHWGFCFFNNVAISLQRLLITERIRTALVLDIDLHFGDGTDNFFSSRGAVTVANIQENHRTRFLEEVDRALSKNQYDIVAISAGFDRHKEDWGGTLLTEDYFTIGRAVREYAGALCNGRYYAVLEGGYNVDVLGANALALCRGMDPDHA
ncbi:MAG: histone deacetylase family protein [Thermodesulfobacteriota bacterium]